MISARIRLDRSDDFRLEVDLSVSRAVTALFGPSGAGKSSILQILAGLERGTRHDEIDIRFGDEIWQSARVFVPPHRRGVGYVFQRPQLFPHLTVEGNLHYAERRARDSRVRFDKVLEWLDLEPLIRRPIDGLSGGEAQRVAIGRALLASPRCLLMDEPLGSVDAPSRRRILPYISRLRRELDIPMVYVTHSMDEVSYLADHVYMIDDGRVTASGTVFEMSHSLEIARDGEADPAAVVECPVRGYDAAFELAELALGEATLYVASETLEPGTRVRVRIPARDVSIALSAATDTSILNVLPAVVESIDRDAARHSVLVRLDTGGQTLLASITRRSAEVLGIAGGHEVFAQVKGVALLTDHG